ncbi:uncharacterized protein LY89DRAFT_583053 [Mollisia scopiformis]|uniref:Zn(2)-C6 fungal-type domain-containing protein n=1 Tax=Mollisia scopiformis TaxID=149040 RepID=A0A194XDF7_MOLSC|nr:uncharacterized protein LY89DRAFT_583053 [Mollisia scopiformis]KUJ18208.1 hypothetical protein LY89DRAFT_583053 [Mollisia scopiformis]
MPTTRETAVGYRRNGKKQACEPCRKGKLACDHGAPFCGRCVRRKTTERCVYHPAPMSKSRNSEPLPTPQQTPSVTSASSSVPAQRPARAGLPPHLATLNNGTDGAKSTSHGHSSKVSSTGSESPVAKLRDTTLDMQLLGYCNASIWANFEEPLSQPRSAPSLTIMSDALFKNEEAPLPPSPDDAVEWLDTFTGPNIRFEMMGLMFCFYGMGYLALQDWDPLFSVSENLGRDRKQTAWRMKECAEVCLDMCDCSETVNYLVAALILNLKRLETACTGDETYHMRRLHGDMITTTITSGLHRLSDCDATKVTAASEYKRRLFCAIYCSDKTHASLSGIPPLLTRTFCDIQPCLDLPDDALLLPQDEMAVAVSQLDAEGWNTSGSTYQLTTLLRARLQQSVLREEILELALGINVQVSISRIGEMHRRCQEVYDALPPQLHYYEGPGVPKTLTGTDLYDRANLLLQFLQNKFLIDRIALARGLDNGQSLLNTAIESIDIALLYWMKRDQLMSFSCNFDWIVTFYGIPSAGVICVELLKKAASQSTVEFSLSDAIQKLTLFIAFLEWIRPTDGNYALAQRLRKVIRRVLDYVLEARNETAKAPNPEIPFDPMLTSFTEMDDLDWLNTIDWTQQASWMDFN